MNTQLLELRKKIKKKKPTFTRQEYPARKNLKDTWRKPKGIHSKMREKKLGKRIQPSMGWRSPREVRGLSKEGLIPILINNFKELEKLTKDNIIIVSKLLGNKKRIELLNRIKEKKFKVLNVKNIEKEISDLINEFKERKKLKEQKSKAKTEEKKKLEKKTEKEPKKEEKTEEQKKVEEKEEKRKVLEGKK